MRVKYDHKVHVAASSDADALMDAQNESGIRCAFLPKTMFKTHLLSGF